MHDTMILIKEADSERDKPTVDELMWWEDASKYLNYISEFESDRWKDEFMSARYLLAGQSFYSMGRGFEYTKFRFDKTAFELAVVSAAIECGLLSSEDFHDTYDAFEKVLNGLKNTVPVAFNGVIYKHIYRFMDEVLEDGVCYEIVDIYNVHL